MDSIHKTGVIVLVFGVVGVGMTRDLHTKFDDGENDHIVML